MKNQWVRILIAGVGAQILYNLFKSALSFGALSFLGLTSAFVFLFGCGFWAALKLESKYKAALNGAFVGVVSIIAFYIYVLLLGMVRGGEGPPSGIPQSLIMLHHFLKIIGGALGGYAIAFKSKGNRRIS